ncbi:CAAX protease self-immunity [Candidatus Nitrososphaera evergladensis SR1]|uniref:CAAX protease self-immunity n=1 Tax=Candidatus Nitrososphaera evergladensis SR1 TaxID=1459636 RepID=A0A075MT89_9ARCH|nr:CPBP family intramembrane glutamic endopeptidase [Candidatus Nitrososphaera evergladensis]AIF84766.1 CAAX protease self-immunity [Candidatus Nitrososphaera evergladensis SR1]
MAEAKRGRFADEKADFNPRTWLTKYRRNSIGYLVKMLLFYHGIGVGLLVAGTLILEQIIPGYQEPDIPRSLIGVLSAGPLEETVFFGVPFYVFNSSHAVIVTGAMWAVLHIFNTPNIELASLAFGNWLFVIPSLFFSLRTWASGKGWFSVVVHSAWNGIFFAAGCWGGDINCTMLEPDPFTNFLMAGLSAALLAGTYVLYRWRKKREQAATGRIQ